MLALIPDVNFFVWCLILRYRDWGIIQSIKLVAKPAQMKDKQITYSNIIDTVYLLDEIKHAGRLPLTYVNIFVNIFQ